MNEKYCSFCGTWGAFTPCACQYADVLGCAGKISCPDCRKAHGSLGTFFRALLGSKTPTRSNSPRTRLFTVLHETVCWHRNEIREKDYVLYSLRETNAFNENSARFRSCILKVVPALPLNATFAETIKRKLTECSIIRAFERLGDELRADRANEQFNAACEQFVRVVAITSR
jgi:hypothetical protein